MKRKSFIIFCSALSLLGMISCKSVTGPTTITTNSGNQIFFTGLDDYDSSQFGVQVINTDGTGHKMLYPGGRITSAPRDGKLLFVRYTNRSHQDDSTVFYLGDINGGKEQRVLTISDWAAYAILSPDGQKIIYDGSKNQIHIFEIATQQDFATPPQMDISSVRPMISDDSRFIYALLSGQTTALFQLNDHAVIQKTIFPDAEYIAASEIHQMFDLSPGGTNLCYYPSSIMLIDSTGKDTVAVERKQDMLIKDINSGSSIADSTNYPRLDQGWPFDDVTWSPKGNKIAFKITPADNAFHQQVVVYDVHSGKTIRYDDPTVNGQYGWIKSIDWSKDESALFLTVDKTEGESYIQKMDASTGSIVTFSISKPGENIIIPMAFRSRDIGEH